MSSTNIVPLERIQSHILVVRGQCVLLDADLAAIYGVPTKRLNEQVKRNSKKFPEDFVFRVTAEEWKQISDNRSQTVTSSDNRSQIATGSIKHRGSRILPYDFTEHGAIQAANILRSDTAIQMSVQVVRAFVQLRHMVVNHKAIRAKLSELDARIGEHDEKLHSALPAMASTQPKCPSATLRGRTRCVRPSPRSRAPSPLLSKPSINLLNRYHRAENAASDSDAF